MVNQWGRDGNFSSSGSRSSGAGAIVIAAIVALLLGAGGGYTAARLLGGASAGDVAQRDGRISDLEKQLSDLKFTTTGNTEQETTLRHRIADLTKANETLKAELDENDGKASTDAAAEIAALKKTIEEAGNVRTELNRARRSLQVSELQIIELEGTIKDQRAEMDKLRKSLTDAATQGDAGSKALSEQVKVLEAALSDARKQAAAAADLRKQLAALQDNLTENAADLSSARSAAAALQKDIAKAKADLNKAKKDLSAALAASKDKGGESDALQKELAAAEEQLAARDGEISTLNARMTQMKQDVEDAKANASMAETQRVMMALNLSSARGEKEKLEGQVAILKQTIESLRAAQREEKPQAEVPTNSDNPSVPTRRDADAVKNALEDMPGYSRLTPDKQIELAQRLEDGACAADALKTTLGRVPAIALRNLIRDLGSKC